MVFVIAEDTIEEGVLSVLSSEMAEDTLEEGVLSVLSSGASMSSACKFSALVATPSSSEAQSAKTENKNNPHLLIYTFREID